MLFFVVFFGCAGGGGGAGGIFEHSNKECFCLFDFCFGGGGETICFKVPSWFPFATHHRHNASDRQTVDACAGALGSGQVGERTQQSKLHKSKQ